tara:strand:- start:3762 stop:4049 length:288 start_codon:yes stop_codon:yes gene_type:complete
MGKLERITVTMPQEMAARLRAAVEEGSYATSSEIVREAVRTWADERDREEAENTAMRAMLDRARAGKRLSADEVFARVRERVAEVAAEELARREA